MRKTRCLAIYTPGIKNKSMAASDAFNQTYSYPASLYSDMPQKMGILWKIRKSIFSPAELFEGVKNEAGIMPAFKYFLILLAIPILYNLVSFLPPPVLTQLKNYVSGIIVLLASTAILHFFVYIFDSRGEYSSTFKTAAYGVTPPILVMGVFYWASWSIFKVVIFFNHAAISQLSSAYGALTSFLNPVFFIALPVWTVILLALGLSVLHEMSRAKALISGSLTYMLTFLVSAAVEIFLSSI